MNSCRGKWVIAETAETVMASLAKAVSGRAFSRSLPLAQWGQDVRALGFTLPRPSRKASFSIGIAGSGLSDWTLCCLTEAALRSSPRSYILWHFKPEVEIAVILTPLSSALSPEFH